MFVSLTVLPAFLAHRLSEREVLLEVADDDSRCAKFCKGIWSCLCWIGDGTKQFICCCCGSDREIKALEDTNEEALVMNLEDTNKEALVMKSLLRGALILLTLTGVFPAYLESSFEDRITRGWATKLHLIGVLSAICLTLFIALALLGHHSRTEDVDSTAAKKSWWCCSRMSTIKILAFLLFVGLLVFGITDNFFVKNDPSLNASEECANPVYAECTEECRWSETWDMCYSPTEYTESSKICVMSEWVLLVCMALLLANLADYVIVPKKTQDDTTSSTPRV